MLFINSISSDTMAMPSGTRTTLAQTDPVTADPSLCTGDGPGEGTVSCHCLSERSMLPVVGIGRWPWAFIWSRPGTQQRQSPFIPSSHIGGGIYWWPFSGVFEGTCSNLTCHGLCLNWWFWAPASPKVCNQTVAHSSCLDFIQLSSSK